MNSLKLSKACYWNQTTDIIHLAEYLLTKFPRPCPNYLYDANYNV